MDAGLAPSSTRSRALAAGGKRLRPLFAYWGWRGARRHRPGPARTTPPCCARSPRWSSCTPAPWSTTTSWTAPSPAAAARRPTSASPPGTPTTASPATATLFGIGAAILVGDLALVWSDELLRCSGISEAALSRARAVWDTMRTEVTAGQYLDLLRAAGGLPGPEGALTVARYKSAGYTVQRPLQLGAAIAGAGRRVVEAYTAIGLPLGEAFQLRDDVLGVFGDPAVTGKSADDDLREGKQTLLVALAEEATDAAGRAAAAPTLLGNPAAGPRAASTRCAG